MKTVKTFLVMMFVCLPFAAQAQSTALNCWTTKGLYTSLTVEETVVEIPNTIAAIDLRGVKAVTLDCSSAKQTLRACPVPMWCATVSAMVCCSPIFPVSIVPWPLQPPMPC